MIVRPIIFSAPMVRAILDGRKTQTRRIVRPQPNPLMLKDGVELECRTRLDGEFRVNHALCCSDGLPAYQYLCPYGQIGDRLWVRETWRVGAWQEETGRIAVDYRDGPRDEWLELFGDEDGEVFNRLWQQSTDDAIKVYGDQERYAWERGQSPCRWRSPIHMPRWASRILLEVTDVRLERVKDITGMDAKCEGAPVPDHAVANGTHLAWARGWFRLLWGEINGTDSWDANPWVWVIEFKRVHSGGEKMTSGTAETRASSESAD